MESAKNSKLRLLRFIAWALLMLAAFQITSYFAPRQTIFVPCLFLPLMVPMVLMPLHKGQNVSRND